MAQTDYFCYLVLDGDFDFSVCAKINPTCNAFWVSMGLFAAESFRKRNLFPESIGRRVGFTKMLAELSCVFLARK